MHDKSGLVAAAAVGFRFTVERPPGIAQLPLARAAAPYCIATVSSSVFLLVAHSSFLSFRFTLVPLPIGC